MEQLKILVVMTTEFGLDGITNVILNYYRAIDKSNLQIDFVLPNRIDEGINAEFERNGSRVFQLCNRMKSPFSYIRKLSRIMKENQYDIVHAHGNSCTLAIEMFSAKISGVKVRISHSHNSTCRFKFVNFILRYPFNMLYTKAFACGIKAGEWLYQNKSFEIITNGININKYNFNIESRELYRRKYNLNNNNLVVGFVGNFNYQKNHDYLISIFAELIKCDERYRLLLVGDGELRGDIEEKINRLGLSEMVTIIGKSSEVPQLLQAMDLIIMPSRYEGLPLSVIEAQAAGLNCFVSGNVTREIALTNLVQFIELDMDPKEWAKIILNAKFVDRHRSQDIINKEIIEAGYDIDRNAKKLKDLYIQYYNEVK